MQTNNPFELIISRLDQLQSSLNLLSIKTEKSLENQKGIIDPDKLLDLSEAAILIRKPVGTVRHYIHHRNLPATKIGKSFLIKKQELLDWFNKISQAIDKKETAMDRMLVNRKRYGKR